MIQPPPRDAEHFHNSHAVTRLRYGALVHASHASNPRFAMSSLTAYDRPAVFAEALTEMHSSKAKAFNIPENAAAEVAK